MLGRSGLQPAPNVPNPRNAGRKKSNPVWEFFTDLRGHGLAGVRCRFCHWVTNDRSPTTMKFHLKRKHDTGVGGLWAICEEKINSQAPANYAPRLKKGDDALLKALTQPRPFQFNPFMADINNSQSIPVSASFSLLSLYLSSLSLSLPPFLSLFSHCVLSLPFSLPFSFSPLSLLLSL